jgi:uncharacterized protein
MRRGSGKAELQRPQRLLLLGAGFVSLALAAIGAVLPLMPTTVFLLIAAWCFGRASPKLQARLHAHPRFGPVLREWEQYGVISPRAKRAAVLAMALGWLLTTLIARKLFVSALAAACLLPVCAYILTRPSRPHDPPAP